MLRQLNEWLKTRHTARLLEAKSDRLLADMGIAREDIPALSRGQDPSDPDAGKTVVARLAGRAVRFAERSLASLAEQRKIRRELSIYRDSELDEIGIKRADIPSVARRATLAG